MRVRATYLVTLVALCGMAWPVLAQTSVGLCVRASPTANCFDVNSGNPLPTTATVTTGAITVNSSAVAQDALPSGLAGTQPIYQSATGSVNTRLTFGGALVTAGNPFPVTVTSAPPASVPVSTAGTMTFASVGTSSATALASTSARGFLTIWNNSTTSNVVCNPSGGVATLTQGIPLFPGSSYTFDSNFVPNAAVNCIAAAAATPITILSN